MIREKVISVIFRVMFVPLFLLWIFSVAMPVQARAESFWETILRIAGISATPSQQRGPGDELEAGDIWVASLIHKTDQRLTWNEGYRSPVFEPGDKTILAINGDNLVRLSVIGGESEILYVIKGAVKLVGFNKGDPDKVLILTEDDTGRPSVGLLSLKNGQVASIPTDRKSKKDRRMLIHIKDWERVYGDTTLYVKAKTKRDLSGEIEWTDVYIKQGNKQAKNISRCNGVNCGQPSLSHGGRQVVFVKAER